MIRRVVIVVVLAAGVAHADDRLLGDDTFAVHAPSALMVDGGLYVATPEALETGMATGVSAGITHACGCHFAYGARVSWASINETSEAWNLTQQDLRLRATGEVRHVIGRGTLALRLGAGATVVRELRERSQQRMGLDPLSTRAYDTLPGADLEAVANLQITGSFGLVISGGPSLAYFQDGVHGKWLAELGVAWQL